MEQYNIILITNSCDSPSIEGEVEGGMSKRKATTLSIIS